MTDHDSPAPSTLSLGEMAYDLLNRTVLCNRWIPKTLNGHPFPSIPQAIFLTHPAEEVLYGGSAGGGKSCALLASSLQYVDTPGYDCLILRRTFPMLEKPDGLIPMSKQWLWGTCAKWDEKQHRWSFPSGATVSFGFLDTLNDIYNYQGPAFERILFDELTQFIPGQYKYLSSRLRSVEGMDVPPLLGSSANPGGVGHAWVKERFAIKGTRGSHILEEGRVVRAFIPARLDDNPGLDKVAYRRQLARLDPLQRRQLEEGDWDIAQEDNVFDLAALIEMGEQQLKGVDGMLSEIK